MANKIIHSVADLRQLISYDPESGVCTWKRRPASMFKTSRAYGLWNTRFANKPIEAKGSGYLRAGVYGSRYPLHRVIWAIQTGKWPSAEIDHINTVKQDNRWANLRLATKAQNARNKARKNKHGLKGVTFKKGRYDAQICINYKKIHLGSFDTAAEAHAAYVKAAHEFHGEFANTAAT